MKSRVLMLLLPFQMAVAAAATPAGPTRLERLALDPDVRVTREEPVGTLDSSDAKLQIFAADRPRRREVELERPGSGS